MQPKKRKNIWKFIYSANWILIFYFWFNGSGHSVFSGITEASLGFGRLAGLAAAYMILLQLFLMGRSPWLEGVFGLDNLSRFHQKNGKVAFYFLLLHPILIVYGYSRLTGMDLWPQFLDMSENLEHIRLAVISLLLFFAVIITSIRITRSGLRYESWYFVHLLSYAAVFGSLFHQLDLGEDLVGSRLFYGYWIGLYSAVLLNHLVMRFFRPLMTFYRHSFYVSAIKRESPSTVSVYISGKDLQNFGVIPGQFMIFRFFTRSMWWQAHPFSLSMMPNGREIRITVKELGDFTRCIKDVPVGTKVLIDGPYGVFTNIFSVSSKILLIAGGIGITPLRPLIEEMLGKRKDVVLLYGSRNMQEIIFKDELLELQHQFGVKIQFVISDDPGYAGERGRIDDALIKRLVPDWKDREVFVCGPQPMLTSITEFFTESGVGSERIHYEKFAF